MPMTGKQRAFHEVWPTKNKARDCGPLVRLQKLFGPQRP